MSATGYDRRKAARCRGVPALVLLAALAAAGCGRSDRPTYSVSGVVTYRGKPLPLGRVVFVPPDYRPSRPAAIGPDGRYQLEAVAGPNAVEVTALPIRPGRPDPNAPGGIDYTGVPEVHSLIPERYGRHDTSGIQVVVEAKHSNQIDLPLE